MPDIKLRNSSGVEQVYTGVDTITVPLADGTGTHTFGLTDEDLTFVNGLGTFSYNMLSSIVEDERINFQFDASITGSDTGFIKTFTKSNLKDLSHITATSVTPTAPIKIAEAFHDCNNLEKLPRFTNQEKIMLNGNQSSNFGFYGCYKLQEDEMKRWLNYFENTTTFQSLSMFYRCYSIRDLSWLPEYLNPLFQYKITSVGALYGLVNYCHCLEKLVIPVFNKNYESTSNIFPTTSSAMWYGAYRLGDISFEVQEDGNPYAVSWKSMILDFSNPPGFTTSTISTVYQQVQRGKYNLDVKQNIFYGSEDSSDNSKYMERWASRYQEVKNHPDWSSWGYGSYTYNGTSVNIAQLYSRFNHASAVKLINSLPDTSAYLATAGGTNTIKFKKYCGTLTDEGGVEALTDEEIAIAASKGWTISFV